VLLSITMIVWYDLRYDILVTESPYVGGRADPRGASSAADLADAREHGFRQLGLGGV